MWFSLFAVVLILTMTFFQGLQGLFSALITCVLAVLSAALAFGFYEELYFTLLMQYLPEQGRAVALVGIFVLVLIVLRVVFDMLISGNMQFPSYVDRAGGGVFGFITAMVIVGMMAMGIQMLPFGPSFLGFSRYALVDKETAKELEPTGKEKDVYEFRSNLDWSKVEHRRNSLWLNPDGFTAGLVSALSSNSLQGQQTLASVYPDFLRSIYNCRSGAFAASRTLVKPDSISLKGYWDLPPGSLYKRQLMKGDSVGKRTLELKQVKEGDLPAGMKGVLARVQINADARDEDEYHRLTTRQCRLVGRNGGEGSTEVSFVAGVNHELFERWVATADGETIARKGGKDGSLLIDLIFLVPARADYVPWFLEYKRNARAEIQPLSDKAKAKQGLVKPIPPEKPKDAKPEKAKGGKGVKAEKKAGEAEEQAQPQPQPEAQPQPQAQPQPEAKQDAQVKKPAQDRVSGLGPARTDCTFKKELPIVLTKYGGNCDVVQGELRGGQVVADLDSNWDPLPGDQPPIRTFQVPKDERLLQLSVEKLQPGSWIGNILGGVVSTISDFYVLDTNGKTYMPVGHYARAMVGGKPMFELQYLDENQRGFGRIPKFTRIKGGDLQGDYAYFFLFIVPPGCKPVTLHTGGRSNVDLKGLNLVAPE